MAVVAGGEGANGGGKIDNAPRWPFLFSSASSFWSLDGTSVHVAVRLLTSEEEDCCGGRYFSCWGQITYTGRDALTGCWTTA